MTYQKPQHYREPFVDWIEPEELCEKVNISFEKLIILSRIKFAGVPTISNAGGPASRRSSFIRKWPSFPSFLLFAFLGTDTEFALRDAYKTMMDTFGEDTTSPEHHVSLQEFAQRFRLDHWELVETWTRHGLPDFEYRNDQVFFTTEAIATWAGNVFRDDVPTLELKPERTNVS